MRLGLRLGKVRYGLCLCHTKNPEQRRAQHILFNIISLLTSSTKSQCPQIAEETFLGSGQHFQMKSKFTSECP